MAKIGSHLKNIHRETHDALLQELPDLLPIEGDPRGQPFLPDFHHSRPIPAVPYLALSPGHVCRLCQFATAVPPGTKPSNASRTARRHLKTHHRGLSSTDWRAHFLPGTQTLQTYYHAQYRQRVRYFPVTPPPLSGWKVPPPTVTDPLDTNFGLFNAHLDAPLPYSPKDDLNNIHPILRQYGFHHYLGAFDRTLVSTLCAGEVKETEPAGYRLVVRVVKATLAHVHSLARDAHVNPGYSRTNMQWIWSFSPNQSVFGTSQPAEAFMENIRLATLLENYAPTVSRLLLVGLRYQRLVQDRSPEGHAARLLLPEFPLHREALRNLAGLEALLAQRTTLPPDQQDLVDQQTMGIVVDALASLLHDVRTNSALQNPNPALVFRFIAMVGAQQDGGFAPCSRLTPPTTHLITASRALVLWLSFHRPPSSTTITSSPTSSPQDALLVSIRHHRQHVVLDGHSSPFVFLHSFFNIAKVLARDEESFTPHVWTDGSLQQRFTAEGRPFDVQRMAAVLRSEKNKVKTFYVQEVLRGLPMEDIALDRLVDDPSCLTPGYSFVTDPANNLRQYTDRALRFFESEAEPDRAYPDRTFYSLSWLHCISRTQVQRLIYSLFIHSALHSGTKRRPPS